MMAVKSHEYLVITIALFLTAAVAVNFIPFVTATLIAILLQVCGAMIIF